MRGLSLHHLSLGRGHATENPSDLDALVSCGKRFSALLESGHVTVCLCVILMSIDVSLYVCA